ncbi:hypothetical protein HHI36_004239 [Cryptolaemus montrouzieri]|uniref:Uncharacterized protein n=1 Tax=Cryptolaemus montrouzieri TaxID=559131 RepID=A0ABD2NS68_9CUCU
MASSSGNRPERVKVLDPNFATVVTGWYEDLLSDNSDVEPDENVFFQVIMNLKANRNQVTDDEIIPLGRVSNVVREDQEDMESDSDVENGNKNIQKYFRGKNRFEWCSQEPTRIVRIPSHNIIRLPGTRTGITEDEKANLVIFFHIMLPENMCNLIVTWTKRKLRPCVMNIRAK